MEYTVDTWCDGVCQITIKTKAKVWAEVERSRQWRWLQELVDILEREEKTSTS